MTKTMAWLIFGCAIVFAWMVVAGIEAWRSRGQTSLHIEEPSYNAPNEVWVAYYEACARVGQPVQHDDDGDPKPVRPSPTHRSRGL